MVSAAMGLQICDLHMNRAQSCRTCDGRAAGVPPASGANYGTAALMDLDESAFRKCRQRGAAR